jgi:hypothetical protein
MLSGKKTIIISVTEDKSFIMSVLCSQQAPPAKKRITSCKTKGYGNIFKPQKNERKTYPVHPTEGRYNYRNPKLNYQKRRQIAIVHGLTHVRSLSNPELNKSQILAKPKSSQNTTHHATTP